MKNDLIEKLYYIENSYSVEDIEYFGIKMWPFLRAEIIYSYYYSDVERQPMTVKKQSKLVLLLQILKTTSFGLFFKKYASLILTDDVGMKYYNGRCIDRIMEGVFEYEPNNIPFIIKMSTASIVSVSRYINASLITVISRCLMFVRPYNKQNFKGEHILIDVLNYL